MKKKALATSSPPGLHPSERILHLILRNRRVLLALQAVKERRQLLVVYLLGAGAHPARLMTIGPDRIVRPGGGGVGLPVLVGGGARACGAGWRTELGPLLDQAAGPFAILQRSARSLARRSASGFPGRGTRMLEQGAQEIFLTVTARGTPVR